MRLTYTPQGYTIRTKETTFIFMPKYIKISLFIAGAVLILAGILFYADPGVRNTAESSDQSQNAQNEENRSKPFNLTLDPLNYDFGTISMKNGIVTKLFSIRNDQNSSVSLAEVYTSCMCTNAKVKIGQNEYGPFGMLGHGAMKMLNQSLAAGQEAQLEVAFDPNAHGPSGIGLIERTVTIQSDKGEAATVNIKANVTP